MSTSLHAHYLCASSSSKVNYIFKCILGALAILLDNGQDIPKKPYKVTTKV